MVERVGVAPHSIELGKDVIIDSIPLHPLDIYDYAFVCCDCRVGGRG